ncbi:MAG: hypothetical protein R6U44_06055 [Archaeoglobaceae archaeon]
MKRDLLIILFFVALLSLSFTGCAQDGDTGPTTTPTASEQQTGTPDSTGDSNGGSQGDIYSYYEGYMDLEKGMWAEWENNIGEQQSMRYVYAGEETIDGKNAVGFEYAYEMEGEEFTAQSWTSASTNDPIKSVIKFQGQVMCYSISDMSLPSTDTPSDYEPQEIADEPNWSHGTYTTDSGKTVDVVKFHDTVNGKQNEIWLSSEVPFGMVKSISDGETVMELKDFGTDADLRITLDDVKNCEETSMPSMP